MKEDDAQGVRVGERPTCVVEEARVTGKQKEQKLLDGLRFRHNCALANLASL